jgi:ABC-2 type transport system permease protein
MTPRAAPLWRMIAAQTRVELILAFRRGESVVITLLIPVGLLLFAAWVPMRPGEPAERVAAALPGLVALAVMSASMVALGIATGFERFYRVLKRIGGSPLPRSGLLIAKLLAVVVLEIIQVSLLLGVAAVGFGWTGGGQLWVVPIGMLLGSAAFAGIGLAMAGALRAELNLAVVNGVYVMLMLFGGVVVPVSVLPEGARVLAGLLPSAALAELFRAGLTPSPLSAWSLVMIACWAVVTPVIATRLFRWD